MLINLSNHPISTWDGNQIQAARQYGSLVDRPFPAIDPMASEEEIEQLANQHFRQIMEDFSSSDEEKSAVHLMGELTFCFALVARLQRAGITCLASTTQRQTIDHPDGSKTTRFGFVRFREYPLLTNKREDGE